MTVQPLFPYVGGVLHSADQMARFHALFADTKDRWIPFCIYDVSRRVESTGGVWVVFQQAIAECEEHSSGTVAVRYESRITFYSRIPRESRRRQLKCDSDWILWELAGREYDGRWFYDMPDHWFGLFEKDLASLEDVEREAKWFENWRMIGVPELVGDCRASRTGCTGKSRTLDGGCRRKSRRTAAKRTLGGNLASLAPDEQKGLNWADQLQKFRDMFVHSELERMPSAIYDLRRRVGALGKVWTIFQQVAALGERRPTGQIGIRYVSSVTVWPPTPDVRQWCLLKYWRDWLRRELAKHGYSGEWRPEPPNRFGHFSKDLGSLRDVEREARWFESWTLGHDPSLEKQGGPPRVEWANAPMGARQRESHT